MPPFDPAKLIAAGIMVLVVFIAGSYVFPDVNTAVTSVNTTGWLPIVDATHSLIPYAFLGAILWGIVLILYMSKNFGEK